MEYETHIEEEEEYSLDWFKVRALNSINKISEEHFDFSDSLLLYIPGADENYEEVQQEGNPYHEMVTAPETAYLKAIARDIVGQLPDHFEYIDLGPGTAKKAQYIFDEMKAQGKTCVYRPVDISPDFLQRAKEHGESESYISSPVQAPFETLPNMLGDPSIPRFVSLGLTYPNYKSEEILNLLASIAGENGYVFVNAQIRDRIDMERLRGVYNIAVLEMVRSKVELLGLDVEFDIDDLHTNGDIEVWGTLSRVTPELSALGLKLGDKLLLFQSHRPSAKSLEEDLKCSAFADYVLLEKESSFLGALLMTNNSEIDSVTGATSAAAQSAC